MSGKYARRLPVPTADIEQGKCDLAEFGYAIHTDFLPPDRVRAVRERLQEQAALELQHGVALFGLKGFADATYRPAPSHGEVPAYQQVNFLCNKGREFIDLVTHPIAQEYVRHALCATPFSLASLTGLVVRRGAQPQIIHIDQQPLPFPTPMPTGLNIMICLSDFEEDMGATRVVPGSHRGPPPTIVVDAATGRQSIAENVETVPAVAPAGSAILFESRLWHGQGAASSEKVRYSVVTNYVMHFLKPAENYPASLHDSVYASLSEDEKRMFGFEAVYAYGGKIAPRFPNDGRSNINGAHPYVGELRRR